MNETTDTSGASTLGEVDEQPAFSVITPYQTESPASTECSMECYMMHSTRVGLPFSLCARAVLGVHQTMGQSKI